MFYAVKKGKIKGIFDNWELCQQQVKGFKNSQYKKFKTKEEAIDYINDDTIVIKQIEPNGHKIIEPETSKQYVYCDGSCIYNGKSNAKASIGIYFGENDKRNVSESIEGNTNNIAELVAMIRVYDIIKDEPYTIVSDSKYALLCVGSYGKKCEEKGWSDIPNKELVKKLYYTYKNTSIQFLHVYSHTNKKDIHSVGNQNADKLARSCMSIN